MALPPEQINIKRRREEEPVETLFIQSTIHQTKRRFTDFVFHRVTLKASESGSANASPSPPGTPAAQRLIRSPRSVSSLHVNRRAPAASSTGVPMVRATSPGAEFREAQRVAAARKEAEEKHRRAVYSGPSPFSEPHPSSTAGPGVPRQPAVGDSSPSSEQASSSQAQALRRFQISRSNLASMSGPGGGVQKRRAGGPAPGVAVLVEQLQRNAHSRKASMVSDLVAEAQALSMRPKGMVQDTSPSSPVKPRKRPVVNQAEKRWREERKGVISAAKQHLSDTMEKSTTTQQRNWVESERLAHEFEQIALELEQERDQGSGMDFGAPLAPNPPPLQPVPLQDAFSAAPKTPLKHQPRQPKEPRVAATPTQPAAEKAEQAVEDDEGDYVYDVYIRRPLSEAEMLKNPLAEYETDQQQKTIANSQPGVGVIVITAEDEEYWEHFVEDDEEEWDSEDADSNAENNPANDYPDEEVSSDDDEFDFDDSASEDGGTGYMSRYRGHVDSDEDY
ncbi:hypothetical protein N7475_001894 [Penicillium sp. IBT 31633x]|nr:hypothetical protein N7475_001894 [Penicillium sp. IBT 31633x]